MTFFHFVYNYLSSTLALIVLPVVWCLEKREPERRRALAQRLGRTVHWPDTDRRGRPKVWIHAVSVGEVKATEAVVKELQTDFPDLSILLTTTTDTGQRYACRQFSGLAHVQYAPVDLWWVVGRFLSAHRPDMLVCMETEIWPNWISKAHARGMRIVMLNGRISHRSIHSYLRVRALIRPVLEKVDAFSMISDADAHRIISLGAPADRVLINGNVKTDAREIGHDASAVRTLQRLYAVDDHTPVFIAGSIRAGETRILMDVYRRLAAMVPELVFIVAPRHIDKAPRIAERASELGVAWQYRTELESSGSSRRAPVLILDTIGELFQVYGLASVVFCGGSLVPLGGQNILEPAMWAKPVLYGPSMEDFLDARMLLEASGGGCCVENADVLVAQAGRLLKHPEAARRMGRLAKEAVVANQGAARRHARVVSRMLHADWSSR
jgi:3-deoxy-D-manno-octulosonic-acid transferase